MNPATIRNWSISLASAFLLGCGGDEPSPPPRGPTPVVVTVSFSSNDASPPTVAGSFHYDQTKVASPAHSGKFSYDASDLHHGITTILSGGSPDTSDNAACPTFQLTTMSDPSGKKTFTLHAAYTNTASPPAPVVIDIALTTLTTLNGDTLPLCPAFTGTPNATGSISKTVGGNAVLTKTPITVTTCTP